MNECYCLKDDYRSEPDYVYYDVVVSQGVLQAETLMVAIDFLPRDPNFRGFWARKQRILLDHVAERYAMGEKVAVRFEKNS